jgi:hypothetical protein
VRSSDRRVTCHDTNFGIKVVRERRVSGDAVTL